MDSVTLELRPRLQTCNAFIHLQESVGSKEVQIKLLDESIILIVGNNTINFSIKSVKLMPTSLSALNIINDWICFRVQTKSESVFGSFKTEVVANSVLKTTFLKGTLETNELLKTTDCSILCTCCKNIISEKAFFKRVLPLPDIDYDLSEWFCCKHDHNNISTNLSPGETDLFYGPCFAIVHTSLFNSNLRMDGNTIICNRCLQCLGKLHTNNSFKIWNCCVDYNLLHCSKVKAATNPLTDFFIAIKTSVNGVLGEEVTLRSFVEKETHYLTVKPMDWHLNLMTEPKVISDSNVISLQRVSVVKVLYKYKTSESANECANAKYCEVALPVIEAGLKHLLLSTKRFPQIHRVAGDYYIGHIHLEEPTNET